MLKGYTGKVLRVDLTRQEIRVDQPPEGVYRSYLGGGAMAAYYLLSELPRGTDPLGPENTLVIMTSAMNGTALSGANRYSVAARSPLTGGYGESEAGGYWGPELKKAGFDGAIIKGQAGAPVYLWIQDGHAELRDASRYWGRVSGEVQDGIVAESGDRQTRVLQTGIAGENGVRFAALVNECRHFHGRTGLGAVMGSKRLKAIAVRGHQAVDMHDPEKARDVLKWYRGIYDRAKDGLHTHGTARLVSILNRQGILPTRHFREGYSEHADAIGGQAMNDTILERPATCYACAVGCKREVRVDELGVAPRYGGPEYETLAAQGSLLVNFDLKKVALANQILNQYVLDSISTGMVIAFAMECFENGILTLEDTDGLELRFGNAEAALALIPKIARREGLGGVLADGVKRAAERIGRGAERYAFHVKGQELPMHDPRGKKSLALAYAISPTGADHVEAPHDGFYENLNDPNHPLRIAGLVEPVGALDFTSRKVRTFHLAQKIWGLYNIIGMCNFAGVPIGKLDLGKMVDYFNAVTGMDASLQDLLKVAERAEHMFRIFNLREGMSRRDDDLPWRLFEPLENGVIQGERIDRDRFRSALREYYELEGWDWETGYPKAEKLRELGLEWAVEGRE